MCKGRNVLQIEGMCLGVCGNVFELEGSLLEPVMHGDGRCSGSLRGVDMDEAPACIVAFEIGKENVGSRTEIFMECVYVLLKVVENESTAGAADRSRGTGRERVCQDGEKQLEDVER